MVFDGALTVSPRSDHFSSEVGHAPFAFLFYLSLFKRITYQEPQSIPIQRSLQQCISQWRPGVSRAISRFRTRGRMSQRRRSGRDYVQTGTMDTPQEVPGIQLPPHMLHALPIVLVAGNQARALSSLSRRMPGKTNRSYDISGGVPLRMHYRP